MCVPWHLAYKGSTHTTHTLTCHISCMILQFVKSTRGWKTLQSTCRRNRLYQNHSIQKDNQWTQHAHIVIMNPWEYKKYHLSQNNKDFHQSDGLNPVCLPRTGKTTQYEGQTFSITRGRWIIAIVAMSICDLFNIWKVHLHLHRANSSSAIIEPTTSISIITIITEDIPIVWIVCVICWTAIILIGLR